MRPNVDFHPSLVPIETYPDADEQTQREALKGSEQLKKFAQYRARVKEEPYYPSYHFYAPDGTINDPNGLCFWKGKYHLFYQAYPPDDPRQHWGHTVSDDLVHWKDLPLAIYPDKEYAVFSGSSLVEDGRVIAIYHGRSIGNMIATSSDPLLLNWEKLKRDPVIPILEQQYDSETMGHPYAIFDPFIWKDETGYYALSGTFYGDQNQRGRSYRNQMVEHLFHSQDLEHWSYMGELAPGGFPQIPLGNDGACPYFWPIGNRYVLFFFSHSTGSYALVGDLDPITHRFTPDRMHKFNFGPVGCSSYQAPCATPDGKGGVYLIFNTTDAHPGLERRGAMSVMYHVQLREDGQLRISPVDAIDSLHDTCFDIGSLKLDAFETKELNAAGKALDIRMTIKRGSARAVRIEVLKSADGREHTDVTLHMPARNRPNTCHLTVDTGFSSLNPDIMSRIPETTAFDLADDEEINVRMLLDKCMLEVFVNDRVVLMQMMYPTLADSEHIAITSVGGTSEITNAKVWKMRSIYE